MGKDYGFGKCSNINAWEIEMKMDYSENQSLLTKLRYAKSPNIRARSSGSKYHDILLMKLRKDKQDWKYSLHDGEIDSKFWLIVIKSDTQMISK